GNKILLKVERAKLRAAINRVGVTASEKSLAVALDVRSSPTGHTLALSSSDLLGNTSSEDLPAEFSGTEAFRAYFDYTRVLDILNALKGDHIEFRFSDNRKLPVRVQEDAPKFLCFIMRLSEQVISKPSEPGQGEAPPPDEI
ncbi:hypothetical protein KW797_02965, partial [Candidatus Parcubacteria bacterium]|nr:hypothetical protein [Candidatus Parcubacteria bacterium]